MISNKYTSPTPRKNLPPAVKATLEPAEAKLEMKCNR